MVDAGTGTVAQRAGAVLLLLVAGILSLPVAAAFLDGEGAENWIIPAQLGGMVLIGAVVGALLPGLAGAGTSSGRAARIGAALRSSVSRCSGCCSTGSREPDARRHGHPVTRVTGFLTKCQVVG